MKIYLYTVYLLVLGQREGWHDGSGNEQGILNPGNVTLEDKVEKSFKMVEE